MKKKHCLRIEKNRIDVLVRAWWLFWWRCHLKGTKKTRDENLNKRWKKKIIKERKICKWIEIFKRIKIHLIIILSFFSFHFKIVFKIYLFSYEYCKILFVAKRCIRAYIFCFYAFHFNTLQLLFLPFFKSQHDNSIFTHRIIFKTNIKKLLQVAPNTLLHFQPWKRQGCFFSSYFPHEVIWCTPPQFVSTDVYITNREKNSELS
jgi:hypothetical protein